ncbi:MAG: family 43 glycosylhydrolase [Phycisphaerae bacterium]
MNVSRALGWVAVLVMAAGAWGADPALDFTRAGNSIPILPGYFADPSLVQHGGHFYIYATIDPWGDKTLGCWESTDFKHWTYHVLNWPTKEACTSRTSKGAMVWAPSVVEKGGKFYMYVSCGSEVWAGEAADPLGPWKSMTAEHVPLIASSFNTTYHMIDQECFLDDDGQAYLYWGSGWNWKNGHCFVVRLGEDMHSFATEAKDVTPAHYFEAPFMMKRKGTYYVMYSDGNTTKDTYMVRYAMGKSPFGPFEEGGTSPILKTDMTRDVISPGHHAMFAFGGRDYILYHRAFVPLDKHVLRQVCVDAVSYLADGEIGVVTPTHDGADAIQKALGAKEEGYAIVGATASSEAGKGFEAGRAVDRNFATRWTAAKGDASPWVQVDLGEEREIGRVRVLPEFATREYHVRVEVSSDGKEWVVFHNGYKAGEQGSPLVFEGKGRGRYVRVEFEGEGSVWEVGVEGK